METEHIINPEEDSPKRPQANPVPDKHEKKEDYRKFFFKLSVTVVVIGIVCLIIGCALTGIISSKRIVTFMVINPGGYNYTGRWRRYTLGSGIWGGFWIMVGGILGVVASRRAASNCEIYLSMAFHIIGALAAFFSCIASAIMASVNLDYRRQGYYLGIGIASSFGLMSFLAFLACVLQVIAASICCPLAGCCDEGGCCCCGNASGAYYGGQIAYRPQPVVYQSGHPPLNYGQAPVQYAVPGQINPGQPVAYPSPTQQGQAVVNPNAQNIYTAAA